MGTFDSERRAIQRRQLYADMLLKQGAEDVQPGQIVRASNNPWVVGQYAPNYGGMIGAAGKSILGGLLSGRADEQAFNLDQREQQATRDWISAMPQGNDRQQQIAWLLQGGDIGGMPEKVASSTLSSYLAPRKLIKSEQGGKTVFVTEDTAEPVREFEHTQTIESKIAQQHKDANSPFRSDGTPNPAYQQYHSNELAIPARVRGEEERRTKQTPGAPSTVVHVSTGGGAGSGGAGQGEISAINGLKIDKQGNVSISPDVQKVLTKTAEDAQLAAKASKALDDLEKWVRDPSTPESGLGRIAATAGGYLPPRLKPNSSNALQGLEMARNAMIGVLNDPRMKGNPSEYEGRKVLETISNPDVSMATKLEAVARYRASLERDLTRHNEAFSRFDAPTQERLRASGLGEIIVERTGNPETPQAPAAAAKPGNPAKISTDAEYEALPSGAVFIGPDGQKRRKP